MSIFEAPVAGWKKFIKRHLLFSGIILTAFVIFYACAKEPDNLGRDLLPASDNIFVKVDSLTRISSYTITGKQILTSANDLYVLGSMKDSIFGLGNASLLTQFHPAVLASADSIRSVDSLVLWISSPAYYGDTLSRMTLRVYELEQKLTLDTSYFSDINPSEYTSSSTELGTGAFNVGDTLIRVEITDPAFIHKIEALPDSVFRDATDFANAFYGLYLKVDDATDKGGYAYLNMSSYYTGMALYVNGDTIGYEMAFTALSAKADVFRNYYSGYPIDKYLNQPTQDTLMYIEGLAGTSGRISFTDLDKWKLRGDSIAINKAELILPVDTMMFPSLSENEYPPKLLLFALQDSGAYQYMYDYQVDKGGNYFSGEYNKAQNAYVFNIGIFLQSYIRNSADAHDPENTDLVIVSRKSNSSANRVILKGASAINSPVKLKVIYTELF
jgi:hypothetical protein